MPKLVVCHRVKWIRWKLNFCSCWTSICLEPLKRKQRERECVCVLLLFLLVLFFALFFGDLCFTSCFFWGLSLSHPHTFSLSLLPLCFLFWRERRLQIPTILHWIVQTHPEQPLWLPFWTTVRTPTHPHTHKHTRVHVGGEGGGRHWRFELSWLVAVLLHCELLDCSFHHMIQIFLYSFLCELVVVMVIYPDCTR